MLSTRPLFTSIAIRPIRTSSPAATMRCRLPMVCRCEPNLTRHGVMDTLIIGIDRHRHTDPVIDKTREKRIG